VRLLLSTLRDINWPVKVLGSASVTSFAAVVAKTLGSEAFENATGTSSKGFTYCGGDPIGGSPYAKFYAALKEFAPNEFSQLAPNSVGFTYAGIRIFQQAAEATGKTDGATLAAWIEQNAGSVSSVLGTLSASKTDHFLNGITNLAVVEHPELVRADGLQKRAGC
jgi:hypothetical protein